LCACTIILNVWGSGATRYEITFVGYPGTTTSLRVELLRDVGFSPPIAKGEVEEHQVDSDTARPHAVFDRPSQRSGLPRSPRRTSGIKKAFASNVDAMLRDLEDAVAPGDAFSYQGNP